MFVDVRVGILWFLLGAVALLVACLLRMRVVQILTLTSVTLFCEDFFPLQLIQEEQFVSYLQKNWHFILVNCLHEHCGYHNDPKFSDIKALANSADPRSDCS